MNLNKAHNIIFVIALFVFIITAYSSHGYFHADEHYQIIEFAGYKLGTHSSHELAWEFDAKIRPTIQPTIAFLVIKFLALLNIHNPYTITFILRLITAIGALFIIRFFIKNTEKQLSNDSSKIIYYLLSYFLWFIPFISSRFSSETWSGLFFLLSLGVLFSKCKDNFRPFLIGILLGISFLFRFQMAFAFIGLALWLIFVKKETFLFLLKIAGTFTIILALGTLLDSWFYGEFTFTPWNYFYANIVQDMASKFGVSKWSYYIDIILSYPNIILGILIFLAVITLALFDPKNIFLWCFVLFVFFHSLIPHKEERFLFPVVYLLSIIIMLSYEKIFSFIKKKSIKKVISCILCVIIIPINTIGLAAMGTKSAAVGRMEITKYIHDHYGHEKINLIYTTWANPYAPWGGLAKFYKEEDMTSIHIDNFCEINESFIDTNKINLLVARKIDFGRHFGDTLCDKHLQEANFVFIIQSIPQWIQAIGKAHKGFRNHDTLFLYKYQGNKKEVKNSAPL